jgi:hypothetical protein
MRSMRNYINQVFGTVHKNKCNLFNDLFCTLSRVMFGHRNRYSDTVCLDDRDACRCNELR